MKPNMRMWGNQTSPFRAIPAMVISLLCCGILAGLHQTGLLASTDRRVSDLRFRMRGERPASDQIALVAVDDRTISAYPRWPLSRDGYALLLNVLEESGARAIGVDLIFEGYSECRTCDLGLATVTAQHRNIVHAITFDQDAPATTDGQGDSGSDSLLATHGWPAGSVEVPPAKFGLFPFRELLRGASSLGHIQVAVDPDGVLRRLPFLVKHDARAYPALSLATYLLSDTSSSLAAPRRHRNGFSMPRRDGAALTLPVDDQGCTTIDFAGDRGAFPRSYSMIDLLQWRRANDLDRLKAAFQGRIVLVGSTAAGRVGTDLGTTPFAANTPGLYVHANALDALLGNRFLRPPSWRVHLTVLAMVSLILGWLFVLLSLPAALACAAFAVVLSAAVAQLLFVEFGIDVPGSPSLLLPPLAYTAVSSYRYIFLQRNERVRDKELAVARDIQRRLLPGAPPRDARLDVFGANVPAREVGGDYYDWISLDDGSVVILVGDVSGKGMSAALLMAHLRASCHGEIRDGASVESIVRAINTSLFRATEPRHYATLFLARISADREEITYCNAGHNPPVLVQGSAMETLPPTGLPVGMFDDGGYSEVRRAFRRGDLLVLYSDGVTECARRGVQYGEERLQGLVVALARTDRSADEIGRAILQEVGSFSRDRESTDDITLVVVRREDGGPVPADGGDSAGDRGHAFTAS